MLKYVFISRRRSTASVVDIRPVDNSRRSIGASTENRALRFRLFGLLATLACVSPAIAESDVEAFYRGRTMEMVVGYAAGPSNDLYARAVAANIGRHIPGAPNVIVRNMPNAGGILATNQVYNVYPRDGTVLATVSQTLPLESRLDFPGVKFRAGQFGWLGRVSSGTMVSFAMSGARVKKIADAFEYPLLMAATSASTILIYPNVLNKLLGTRFKMVMGYPSSPEALLAVQRGEAEALTLSWDSIKSQDDALLSHKQINPLVQYSVARHPDLPDLPTMVDLGRTEREKNILATIGIASDLGKSFFTTPGVPPERLEALRRAFEATLQDPAFKADLTRMKLDLIPLDWRATQKIVEDIDAAPQSLIDEVAAVYQRP